MNDQYPTKFKDNMPRLDVMADIYMDTLRSNEFQSTIRGMGGN